MQFHVLGPVEGSRGDRTQLVRLAGKQRLLLAMLLVQANRVVSVDALVCGLWGDERPASAVHLVHNLISQIRRVVETQGAGVPEIVVRSEPGYRLVLHGDELDAARFEQLLAEGRRGLERGHYEEASTRLSEGLGLWRGPAFADLADIEAIRHEARRLDGLRVLALEERIEADLRCSRAAGLVEELEVLVADHPLRERLWGQLIRCLYRSGRQADALAAYQRVRRHLAQELGLEPSPALVELERAVLSHAPELARSDRRMDGEPAAPRGPGGRTQAPITRYARTTDGLNVAYQVAGDGPVDLIIVPGFTSHLDVWSETWPELAQRLACFTRLILFDKRGMGLSDRPEHVGLEQWVQDTRAVLDAVGSRHAVVLGMSAGGTVAALFAATYPERVRSLILYGSRARYVHADDYPFGIRPEAVDALVAELEAQWGTGLWFERYCPSAADDADRRAEFGRFQRMSASPGAAAAYLRALLQMDVRHALPAISVPTMVLHATRDVTDTVEQARYMAARIPHAKMVELDSGDHLMWLSDALGEMVDEIQHFVTGEVVHRESSRVLATILCLNVAGRRADPNAAALVDRLGGKRVSHQTAGICAMFDGPGRAIRCATAIVANSEREGREASAGLHSGECELLAAGDVQGMAAQIAGAIVDSARPGDVLVSQTVRDVVIGTTITFNPRGDLSIDGVPGTWQVLEVTGT